MLASSVGWLVGLAVASLAVSGQGALRDPDRLYDDRAHLASAVEAAQIWESRVSGGAPDYDAAWKLARVRYWLGGHVSQEERRAQYERGIEAGKRAIALEPAKPEGHFWTAANMGTLAESFGLRAGLRYRGAVKRELELVLSIDPAYQEGSADRVLGRWYFRVPRLFGGSKEKSVEHLRRSLTYDPDNAQAHLFLADTLLAMDRRDEAERELQRVLDAPVPPQWIPEVAEFKAKAAETLARLRR
jgi:tetratricopeptide (TPR) repeat protein